MESTIQFEGISMPQALLSVQLESWRLDRSGYYICGAFSQTQHYSLLGGNNHSNDEKNRSVTGLFFVRLSAKEVTNDKRVECIWGHHSVVGRSLDQ
jgi:hypothetical protein